MCIRDRCFIFGILVACGLVYAGFYRYAQDLLGIVQVRAADGYKRQEEECSGLSCPAG